MVTVFNPGLFFQYLKLNLRTTFNLMSTSSSPKSYVYNPLHPSKKWDFQFDPYIIIILNRPINLPPESFSKLWDGALQRTVVDGGAARWLNYVTKYSLELKTPLPDLLCGDFDSISKSNFEWFQKNNVKIVHTPDQNFTDFQKALKEISKLDASIASICKAVVVVCECGGRIDQLFSTLSSLSEVSRSIPDAVGYILSTETLSWLLPPGEHTIEVPPWDAKFPCALLPFSPEPSSVTTTGLQWNLSNQDLAFGGLVSSSNQAAHTQVKISTKSTILWSMGIEYDDSYDPRQDSAKL